ncbi:MAG TPA: alpha-1,2-fucosyltransferase [Candidatus Paceibacterota bacterium]|mgnify:CR=1 FL=1|nr:alpha-1,2-fucosyltransferase [Candidatus Paceibacterota bacterium]HMP19090.1 alpha-1,2-fucosyltransferase [Candidatus Paceibacterota bacterium]
MKKIEIKGGLGNQMFQYAYGRALSVAGEKILFVKNFPKNGMRSFRLDVYNISDKINFIDKKNNYIKNKFEAILSYLNIKKEDGYYQSEDYFKNIKSLIKQEFSPKTISSTTKELESKIKNSTNPTAIHIRRSDYLNKNNIKLFHICDKKYYIDSINQIINLKKEKNTDFFIFTDDIKWAKENLSEIEKIFFISDKKLQEYEEIYLMSVCKNNIISNSTFAWWGAWLNKNGDKIVIAPKYWFKNKLTTNTNIIPKEWITI